MFAAKAETELLEEVRRTAKVRCAHFVAEMGPKGHRCRRLLAAP